MRSALGVRLGFRRFRVPYGAAVCMLIGAGLGYGVLGLSPAFFSDERFHIQQIAFFTHGRFEIAQPLTTFPGYHFVLAMAGQLSGAGTSAPFLRLVNFAGSTALFFLIWRMAAASSPLDAQRRVVQWFYMPLLFPFLFLVYTDVWALVAVIAMIACALKSRGYLAAVAAMAALLLRQDMVIWVFFATVLMAFGEFDPQAPWRRILAGLRLRLPDTAPMCFVLVLYGVFIAWNGGVAMGDKAAHPAALNVTNAFFLLLCAWMVFLPLNIAALPRVMRLIRSPVAGALVGVGFIVYMQTFSSSHPYNSNVYYKDLPTFHGYLRNDVLHYLTEHLWLRAVAYVPMAWMMLTACATRLPAPRLYWLYAVAPISAALHPLIEQRYYLPAMTLFHIWRPGERDVIENSMLLLYLAASGYVVWGIAGSRFFL